MLFPESLTVEKMLGVTWRADKGDLKIISPSDVKEYPDSLRQLLAIQYALLNSIHFTKTGNVEVTYTDTSLGNNVFYYKGKWIPNPNDKEELLVKMGSPMGTFECRIKVRQFSLLNNMLVMEAYFLNPAYSFSVIFSGKGAVEDYWSKETDVVDFSWMDRNRVSDAPIQYSDIVGAYNVNREDWKRVIYIDDYEYNLYPLLSRFHFVFETNGNVQLNRLPVNLFGVNFYNGTWKLSGNKILLDFPIFPFRGNIHQYSNVFEIDFIPLVGPMYARHNAGIVMEIVKIEQDRILVKFTELGICSAYVYLNKA